MQTHTIAVIPGDGVGQEIIPEAKRLIMRLEAKHSFHLEYTDFGGFLYQDQPDEVAVQTSVFTRRGVDRVVRYAFELARRRNGKKRVTSITKSNAQGYSLVLWDRAFAAVAADYPDISTESL